MKISLLCGTWGQNIGNAFFNLGGMASLEPTGHQVSFVQDHPAYWTFRDEQKGNYPNAWPILEHLETDLVVAQGPLFTRNFLNIWAPTLRRLKAQGRDWALLSCAFRSYTSEEIRVVEEAFEIHRPVFVSTRDRVTADLLRPFFGSVRSGIDSAFFLPRSFSPPALRGPEPLVVCFDHYPEPRFEPDEAGVIDLDGTRYRLEFGTTASRLARRSKGHAYIGQLFTRRSDDRTGPNRLTVRPEHRANPHLPFKIYRRSNGLASDEPWTLLTVYANSFMTISDRVHACVATLAYGGRAYLHNPTTKRSSLFDAVGVADVERRVVRVDPARIDDEWGDLQDFLESVIGHPAP